MQIDLSLKPMPKLLIMQSPTFQCKKTIVQPSRVCIVQKKKVKITQEQQILLILKQVHRLLFIPWMFRAFIGLYKAGRTTPWQLQPLGVVSIKSCNILQKVANATLQLLYFLLIL